MDDNVMETIRSISKEMQKIPETAMYRPSTAARPSSSTGGWPPTPGGRTTVNSEVTTLASYRPESAAFTFTFNRPRTGRMDSDRTPQPRGPLPSARPSRQGLTSSRPSPFRKIDESDSYIPDLDEVREDDLTMTVASAPTYELQRMASLTELDSELLAKALSIVDGVSLRKLCRFLVPAKELVEQDEIWTWDRLYTEIISSPEFSHLVRFQKKDNDTDFDSLSIK